MFVKGKTATGQLTLYTCLSPENVYKPMDVYKPMEFYMEKYVYILCMGVQVAIEWCTQLPISRLETCVYLEGYGVEGKVPGITEGVVQGLLYPPQLVGVFSQKLLVRIQLLLAG